MAEQNSSRGRRGLWLAGAVVGLFVVFQVVMLSVRRHVDGEIDKSVGTELFAFELRDLDGKLWNLEALAGRKVVLNFFRSYCQSCQIEAPAIRRLAAEVDPDDVVVLGVMMDQVQGFPAEATQRTLEEFGFRHPVLMADEAFLDAFHGAGWSHVTPVTYIADANGRISAALRGHQTLDELREAVRQAE